MPVDLHKLEHLVTVVEEGSFTRAAARLHLTQQALSTSIRVLEREVGVPLLDRHGARLSVLPAGRALIEDAYALRGAAHAALHRARRIGRGQAEVLRIGHTPAVTVDDITDLLHRARTAVGDPAVEVNQRYPRELTSALLAGELDLGLCRAMTPARGLARSRLCEQPLRIAVSADHPLAAHRYVALSELSEETFVVWGQPGQSGYTDLLLTHCRHAGFEPHIERSPMQGIPPVTAVIGTHRLAFVTTGPGPEEHGRVHVLDLQPPIHTPMYALWNQHTHSPARDTFLHTATAD
ncbi:LysR substrate-binding domain-containing protein [Nocardia sp. NPDC002869]|uniref:LysR substrate-binding domain-containing protein n=1 Tax=Nocardia sp. NPDC002869 TaxID=3161032 RepID=UPI00398C94F9